MRLETSNSITDERAVVYMAEDLTQGSSFPDDTERLKLRQLQVSEAIALAVETRRTLTSLSENLCRRIQTGDTPRKDPFQVLDYFYKKSVFY